ncbi:dephospho-CoA kinase [Pseudidiomarina sediminum]|uniref:Dephospho-CoA kinase n=1 Tax=Pseudidiomarina sediminum TaxID=431675 RepID=A0A432Z9P8_9GAMM|nr:dephospho-CoA kinase [Pseudidiomarina sediminum]MBY6063867.1 dephospho-CoA kinase [Pseudidiomarina sediminum]RUO74674.1 dephospho-CoA kinase [Pseudidiomarina sediminum]
MWVLGVTGGIGSGKTTVTDLFAALGITIVDADVIARHIMDPGGPALNAVIERYGEQALQADGQLNRAWLRERIFQDNDAKAWLNALTHPLIRTQIHRQLEQAASPYVILSAPLLVENKLTELCDRVLVVDVPEEVQRQRTIKRDQVSAAQVELIMQSQCSREERLAFADDVINNDVSRDALQQQVEALHQHYLVNARQAAATKEC